MIHVRDKICDSIQEHNKFTPIYNKLAEPHECLTDYELVTTLYREKFEVSKALDRAKKLNIPVYIGDIGPITSILTGVDYVRVYVTKDNRYLTKRVHHPKTKNVL